jgi:hypothetical protein
MSYKFTEWYNMRKSIALAERFSSSHTSQMIQQFHPLSILADC